MTVRLRKSSVRLMLCFLFVMGFVYAWLEGLMSQYDALDAHMTTLNEMARKR